MHSLVDSVQPQPVRALLLLVAQAAFEQAGAQVVPGAVVGCFSIYRRKYAAIVIWYHFAKVRTEFAPVY